MYIHTAQCVATYSWKILDAIFDSLIIDEIVHFISANPASHLYNKHWLVLINFSSTHKEGTNSQVTSGSRG